MALALPSRPSLDSLRKTARQQLRELRASQPNIQLAAAQLALARDYGSQAGVRLRPTWNSYKVVPPANSCPVRSAVNRSTKCGASLKERAATGRHQRAFSSAMNASRSARRSSLTRLATPKKPIKSSHTGGKLPPQLVPPQTRPLTSESTT